MEEVHGVDVSWIHHSHKDRLHPTRSAPAPPPKDVGSPGTKSNVTTTVARAASDLETPHPLQSGPHQLQQHVAPRDVHTQARAIEHTPLSQGIHGIISSPPAQPSRLPGLLRSNSREKVAGSDSGRTTPKRSGASSWISSISSKLGTSSPHPPTAAQPVVTAQNTQASAPSHSPSNGIPQPRGSENGKPYVPQQPKSGSSSFLTSALRRLSSTGPLGKGGSASHNGGIAPRRILNVDPNRERCMVPELDTTKLRRVAFCVDVEIAGAPKYKDDENFKDSKKEKVNNIKAKDKEEGAALKRPTATLAEKDEAASNAQEIQDEADLTNPAAMDKKDGIKKKEKKKRTDEEKKERKEQKRRKAEENGSVPMQITRENSTEPIPDINIDPAPRPLTRPTTDPLRIYRRCCQLRETPILKRITDQLGASTCHLDTPGMVTILDLTGSRLQLADMITLSDWLAIVPVRKLLLDDADLNDEGLRVILAGLLAAVTPDFSRKSKTLREKHEERSGVIEKLCLRDNPKITKEGWKHISLFIYMCKSLKAIDVSMNAFPTSPTNYAHVDLTSSSKDIVEVFSRCISERLGGNTLEELIMGECSLTTYQIRKIIDAVSMSGITRLGLAGNSIDAEGLNYIIHYIKSGVCQGLDLGGNDLRDHLDVLGDAFDGTTPIWALSFADCNLDTASLKSLFPGLLNLKDLRFLDLSHNPELFTQRTNALPLLAKYLPQMQDLRRLHLNHVDMTSSQAIALADIIGELPMLAHLAILGNPQLTALASATGEEEQEEACALYASLMAAARVSRSIISIEIDVPSPDNSEIVRALAQQVVAYCLRNMEAFYPAVAPDAALTGSTSTVPVKPKGEIKEVEIPDVLVNLVGHYNENQDKVEDDAAPAPDMDYIVGGTGVVKALNYCLPAMRNGRNGSASNPQSGTASPLGPRAIGGSGVKAKNMSKNLLDSARRIRERLQPTLVRESKGHDDWAFRRLLFLDNTLRGIIERFEAEFPETRVSTVPPPGSHNVVTSLGLPVLRRSTATDTDTSQTLASTTKDSDSEDDDDDSGRLLHRAGRQASDVSLAARALGREEGTVHKIGQQVKRKILEHEQNNEDGHDTGESSKPGSPGEVDEDLMIGGRDSSIEERIEDEHIRVLKEKLNLLSASPPLDGKAHDGHD